MATNVKKGKAWVAATRQDLANPGAVFVLREAMPSDESAGFPAGTRLELDYDDGSAAPRFRKVDDLGVPRWLNLAALELEQPAKPEMCGGFKVGDRVRIKAGCTQFTDYRPGESAVVIGINIGDDLPISIEYTELKAWTSCVQADYLEFLPSPTVTITISRDEAEAFNACFNSEGYTRPKPGLKRSEAVAPVRRALAEQLESDEVKAAKVLLAKHGYEVTAKE